MGGTTSSSLIVFPRQYLDADFEPTNWQNIELILTELLHRTITDLPALQQWLVDWSEVFDVLDEHGVWREIKKDQNTQDEKAREHHLQWVEHVQPRIKALYFKLQRKLTEHPLTSSLDPSCGLLLKRFTNQQQIFRTENAVLEATCERLVSDYFKLRSSQSIECDWTNPDRAIRESTYREMAECRLKDCQKLDEIIDSLLVQRTQIAQNADFADFREFRWRQLDRFDYTPANCLQAALVIEKVVVPRLHRIDRRHATRLGVNSLRDWDLRAEPPNVVPLRPFDAVEQWISRTRDTFKVIDERLARDFDVMVNNGLLDLEPRKDKADFVGYQQFLRERRVGFIFLYPKFDRRDVEGLLHECGHAFHTLAYQHQRLTWNRNTPNRIRRDGCQCDGNYRWRLSWRHLLQ